MLLELAQQFSFATYSTVVVIGLTQGIIIGQAIIERFPRLQYHARLASLLLFLLFATHATMNVMNFAYPNKVNVDQLLALTPESLVSIILNVMGLNMNIGAIISFSVTSFIVLIFKLTGLKGYRSSFILIINVLMLIIMSILKFSDYHPSSFEIFLFILYHASLTGGLLWGTRRKLQSKELRIRNFIDWWNGDTK